MLSKFSMEWQMWHPSGKGQKARGNMQGAYVNSESTHCFYWILLLTTLAKKSSSVIIKLMRENEITVQAN